MTVIEDLIGAVVLDIPSVPDSVAEEQIRRSIKELCRQGRAWRTSLPLSVTADIADYNIDDSMSAVSEGEVAEIISITPYGGAAPLQGKTHAQMARTVGDWRKETGAKASTWLRSELGVNSLTLYPRPSASSYEAIVTDYLSAPGTVPSTYKTTTLTTRAAHNFVKGDSVYGKNIQNPPYLNARPMMMVLDVPSTTSLVVDTGGGPWLDSATYSDPLNISAAAADGVNGVQITIDGFIPATDPKNPLRDPLTGFQYFNEGDVIQVTSTEDFLGATSHALSNTVRIDEIVSTTSTGTVVRVLKDIDASTFTAWITGGTIARVSKNFALYKADYIVDVSAQPLATSTDFPQIFNTLYKEAVVAGALYFLYKMPMKVWTNAGLANLNFQLFITGVNQVESGSSNDRIRGTVDKVSYGGY